MSSNGHVSPSVPVKKVSLSFNNTELGGGARRSFSREGSFLGNSNATSVGESSFIPISPFSKQPDSRKSGGKAPEQFVYPETTPEPLLYPETKVTAPAKSEDVEVSAEERRRQQALAQEHLKVEPVEASVLRHVQYTLARRHQPLTSPDLYLATALSVRERLIERWTDTQSFYTTKVRTGAPSFGLLRLGFPSYRWHGAFLSLALVSQPPGRCPCVVLVRFSRSAVVMCRMPVTQDPKRVCYLSLEYLVGRCLHNTIHNLGVEVSGISRSFKQTAYFGRSHRFTLYQESIHGNRKAEI
jgi:hypothetical protein